MVQCHSPLALVQIAFLCNGAAQPGCIHTHENKKHQKASHTEDRSLVIRGQTGSLERDTE